MCELHVNFEGFRWEVLSGRVRLGEAGVDGNIILKWNYKETGWDSVDWIDLAQDGDE